MAAGVILVKAEQDSADSKEQQLEHASTSRLAPVGTGLKACTDVLCGVKDPGKLAYQLECYVGDFKAGDTLGGTYTVVETLGRGSSGVTYKV